jgi:U3 small nucleolar ribonucleoprotein protein IMP4
MIRRNIRLRKEYLYTKSQEAKEAESQKKRIQVRKAIDNDTAIPNEWRKEKDQAIHQANMGDDHTMAARTAIDDEYEEAKYRDPKLLITTSRDPSSRLVQF